jgi:stress-induced-phosphoprotein 1
MNDPRMMQIMLGLMGLDGSVATNDDELERAKEEANENLERRAEEQARKKPEPEPTPEPEPEMTDEDMDAKRKRDKSDEEKNLGNQLYKKRQFDEALKHYDAAWNADETNVAVLTNKAGLILLIKRFCLKCKITRNVLKFVKKQSTLEESLELTLS